MIEYEMKFQANHQEIKSKLLKLGAKYNKEVHDVDYYFNHPTRDFRETDEALRIRETERAIKITYKGPKIDTKSKTREEIEFNIESLEMKKILKRLGFVEVGIVNKNREFWELQGYTITLDTVKELGEFVEIEIVNEDDQVSEEVVSNLHEFVKSIGLNPDKQILISYLGLLQNSI